MKDYIELVKDIYENGVDNMDRTGHGTRSVFCRNLSFDLRKGFPLMTHKRMVFKSVVAELIWFLSGSTNNNHLNALGSTIWDEWANSEGELGPIYGRQWRNFCGTKDYKGRDHVHGGVDQIEYIMNLLINNPKSRRMVVVGWNPCVLPDEKESHETNVKNNKAVLPACHNSFMFYADPKKKELSLKWDQRSCDVLLGLPYNIASYALLLHIVSDMIGYKPRMLHTSLGDVHLYSHHISDGNVDEVLKRELGDLPTLELSGYFKIPDDERHKSTYIDNFVLNLQDAKKTVSYIVSCLKNYKPNKPITMQVAV